MERYFYDICTGRREEGCLKIDFEVDTETIHKGGYVKFRHGGVTNLQNIAYHFEHFGFNFDCF